MKVVYIQRKPQPNHHFSIEKSFAEAREHLPPDIEHEVFVPRFSSHGLLRRLWIAAQATLPKADVKHITGDIHFAALALRGSRTVLTVHDCGSLHRTAGIRRSILRKLWYDWPIAHVAAVTTVSHFTRSELLRAVSCDPSRVHVIPTCISSLFHAVPKPELSDPPVILQVGTKPNKNLERVAQALAGIPCMLNIVGVLSQAQEQVLRDHAIAYTSVAGIPEPELLRLYRQCDVVSFVSTYEGFGMPVIEGQAVGRPVITSNVASIPEIAGPGACCVDPHDVQSIRSAFVRVLSDASYRRSLVEAGLANCQRFSAQAVAQQYASLYRSLDYRTV